MIKSSLFPPKNTPKVLQKWSTKKKMISGSDHKTAKYLLILIIVVFAEYLTVAAFVNIALR